MSGPSEQLSLKIKKLKKRKLWNSKGAAWLIWGHHSTSRIGKSFLRFKRKWEDTWFDLNKKIWDLKEMRARWVPALYPGTLILALKMMFFKLTLKLQNWIREEQGTKQRDPKIDQGTTLSNQSDHQELQARVLSRLPLKRTSLLINNINLIRILMRHTESSRRQTKRSLKAKIAFSWLGWTSWNSKCKCRVRTWNCWQGKVT